MLNKPSILTLLLIVISLVFALVLGLIFALMGMKTSPGASAVIVILASFFVGQIYTNKYEEELPKNHKVKIAIYYFLIQMIMTLGIMVLLNNASVMIPILAVGLFLNSLISFFVYLSLGYGSRMKLKKLGKNDQDNEPEP